ncbi:MAG: DUF1415 family protein [Verrucomicrobiota bacterium]
MHLLREESVERAIRSGDPAEAIVARNQRTLRALGPEGWRCLVTSRPAA